MLTEGEVRATMQHPMSDTQVAKMQVLATLAVAEAINRLSAAHEQANRQDIRRV